MAVAARIVATLGQADVKQLARGVFPEKWEYLKSYSYVIAAKSLVKMEVSTGQLLDRMDGPVVQKNELSGPDGAPLPVIGLAPPPAASRGEEDGEG